MRNGKLTIRTSGWTPLFWRIVMSRFRSGFYIWQRAGKWNLISFAASARPSQPKRLLRRSRQPNGKCYAVWHFWFLKEHGRVIGLWKLALPGFRFAKIVAGTYRKPFTVFVSSSRGKLNFYREKGSTLCFAQVCGYMLIRHKVPPLINADKIIRMNQPKSA